MALGALARRADGEMSEARSGVGPEARVAVVTGGATGIGRAVCQALAAKGMRVGVVYNSSEAGARSLAGGLPGAFFARADIADPAQVEALVRQLQETAGRVDVLVNNAGLNRDAPIFSMKIDDYDAVAGLARGTWYLTKLVLRRFMLRSGGRIVNVSSVVGHTGNAGQIPYTMVKAGLDAMTRSLAQEMRGREILVNSVAPGFIDTDMTAGLPDEVRSRILERVPLGRMGRPEEVAEVVAFLATAGSYVTGSVIHVNGGMYGG
jgi:3-oxoacyl-[acyl-carrier protein] reductase